ncbi:type I methionyl aminopeptidase [Arcanobacterium buesumense]|uniref:Methionine aminopeptidase n=1 Tax=Arcanobacterium buesumense TaxID=2722751 RepID=A0A6H2EMJ5_9ACTO|nr:type I methionyl aminopeptidase [Arcanobacterium buesumense]QJC22291.1 type I methionyl aminopeptidase [Arcanobacterium buesumense]
MGNKIQYKTDEQIIKMRTAGLVVAQIHAALRAAARPGVTTADMDQVALEVLNKNGARSNFYGYYDYPGQICTSVNEEIVHGIPGPRVLEPGDLVSFDCGAVVDGWHADACISVVIPGGDPKVTEARQTLSDITRESMWVGIAAMATGKRVGDIGDAIDEYVETLDDSVRPDIVLDYTGHGIGDAMHQEPEVLNYSIDARTPKLKPGMVLCIEPMLTAGVQDNHTLADEWTVVTDDGADACHWEHMVALHQGGIWVLTEPDGGASELARFGITVAPLS